jgi:ABC-type Mn2+/Zn2+ transport system permease subunit
MSSLLEPWRDPTTRSAFAELLLIAVSAGALGCWVVLLELSYSAESLAHAMFPGLVLAALTGIPLLLGGAAGVAVAAGGVALAARAPGADADTGVAVVITGLFGLGVLLALSPDSPPGIEGLLFGDILAVSNGDLALAAGLAVVVIGALALLHSRLAVLGFDRAGAPALGLRPGRLDLAVLALIALSVLVAVQGLGNLLVVAVLIAPAASARRVTRRVAPMMAVAVALAMVAGLAGLYVSYYAGVAAGAAIAAGMVVLYALTAGAERVGLVGRSGTQPI